MCFRLNYPESNLNVTGFRVQASSLPFTALDLYLGVTVISEHHSKCRHSYSDLAFICLFHSVFTGCPYCYRSLPTHFPMSYYSHWLINLFLLIINLKTLVCEYIRSQAQLLDLGLAIVQAAHQALFWAKTINLEQVSVFQNNYSLILKKYYTCYGLNVSLQNSCVLTPK